MKKTIIEKNVEKALKQSQRKRNNFISWWKKNNYKVYRIILFPIWIGICIKTKIKDSIRKNMDFTEEKAKNFLDKYLIKSCDIDTETGDIYFFSSWQRSFRAKGLKDKTFQSKYYIEIFDYLMNKYEIKGYTKIPNDERNQDGYNLCFQKYIY